MKREPYRLFRLDREDVLVPLKNDVAKLARERAVAGRTHGYNSEQWIAACEAMRQYLYNEQDTILDALRELCDATAPEVSE